MKKIKKAVKMNSLKQFLIFVFLIIAMIFFLIMAGVTPKTLTSYCQVKNIEDLNRCSTENPYVQVYTSQVYDTYYDYLKNNRAVARFIDIDMKTHWLIALTTSEYAKELISDTSKNIVIKGKLEEFESGAKQKGYQEIKNAYINEFKESMSKEEVLNHFTMFQLNQYAGEKTNLYLLTVFGFLMILWFLIMAFKQVKYVLHPERYQINRFVSLEQEKEIKKIMQELESGNYDYHEKNIYLTKHYLIVKAAKMKVAERKNIVWIYERIMKQHGITTVKSWFVYSLDQKVPFSFSKLGKKHQQLRDILKQEFPHATFGYSNELNQKWKKNPESFLEEVEQ